MTVEEGASFPDLLEGIGSKKESLSRAQKEDFEATGYGLSKGDSKTGKPQPVARELRGEDSTYLKTLIRETLRKKRILNA